jgi:hypothetical protein
MTVTMTIDELLERIPAEWRAAVARTCAGHELVAEACWHRDDPRAEHVIGLVGGRPPALAELARACVPQHAARVEAWLAAMPSARDVGFKIGHRGLQLYLRGEFGPAEVTSGLAAAGAQAQEVAIRNFLVLFEQVTASMVGLELANEAANEAANAEVGGAVYASVLRTPERSRALRDAFGLLVRIAAPERIGAWAEAAPILFDASDDEMVYVSMSTTLERPWAKLDVARRPFAIAQPLYTTLLGARGDAVLESARPLGTAFSHVGVRFGGGGAGPTFYLPLIEPRDVA